MAIEFERAAKKARAGNLIESQAREVLNDIMKRVGAEEFLRAPSTRAYLNDWLASKKVRKSQATGSVYTIAIEKFLISLGVRADKPLTTLVSGDVQRFLDERLKAKTSASTTCDNIKCIRMALGAARKQGLIPTNPAEAVELPRVRHLERGTFTSAEVKMLVDTADGEWKTIILTAYYLGARLGDCCNMAWAGVDLKEGVIMYIQKKTGDKVCAPLHPELLAHLKELATSGKTETFVAPHMAGLKSGGRHGLSEGFKRIMSKAGVDLQNVKSASGRNQSTRSFHALRHSFASALANAGVSPELRKKLTGHRSDAVHAKYTHYEMENLRAAVGKLSGISNLASKKKL